MLETPREPSAAPRQTWKIPGTLDEFEVTFSKYGGLDFSRIAFMFCGQGQIARGSMADVAAIHPVFLARLQEIDTTAGRLGYDRPSRYILDGSATLSDSEDALFATLCLFGLQLAMFEVSIHRGFVPEALTAHSFGEYALLVAAGVFDFRDMTELIVWRHRSIEAAAPKPAAMFAVNGSQRLEQQSLRHEIRLANRNTPFQSTYVCRAEDFAGVREDLKGLRIPFVPIPLRVPFHTPWMEEARRLFAEKIRERGIVPRPPKIPYVSSVGARWVDRGCFDADATLASLSEQLTTNVDFPAQLARLNARRFHHFFELSPIDVLTGFAEQCQDLSGERFKVNSFRRHFKTLQTSNKTYDRFKSSKLFTALDSALKSLTGYSIHSIQLEDRIREDLGIDSIKKAEIVFEIIDLVQTGTNLAPTNLADLSSFGDILEYLEASTKQAETADAIAAAEAPARFAPFGLTWVERPLTDYQPTGGRAPLVLEDRSEEAHWTPAEALAFALEFKAKPLDVEAVVFLRGDSPRAAAKDAFLATYAREKKFTYKSILLAKDDVVEPRTLALELEDFRNARVSRRDGVRKTLELAPRPAPVRALQPRKVLCLGGLGGIGRQQLLRLRDPQTIVIVGRAEGGPRVAELAAHHPEARIEYHRHDIRDPASLRALIRSFEERLGVFDCAIHSVGIEISADLSTATEQELESVLTAKMTAAEALHAMAQADPGLTVIFNSSIVSSFTSRGQSAYALANAYLNALADSLPNALAIGWPGWDETGVTVQDLNRRSLRLQGARLMKPEQGGEIFTALLRDFAPGTTFVIDGPEMEGVLREGEHRSLTEKLLKPASRDHSLMSVPSLTQKEMPYLTDHLVQRACIFPASGSLALMLYRAYLKTGRLGNVRNFQAINFLVVPTESSNVSVKVRALDAHRMSLQVQSHQPLAQADICFDAPSPAPTCRPLRTDQKGVTDFDQTVSVYTGPKFLLTDVTYTNSLEPHTLLELDLDKAPRFLASGFADKFHRLLEFGFNSAHSRGIQDFGTLTVPKSFGEIIFHAENLGGRKFVSLMREMQDERDSYLTDVTIFNEFGRAAIEIRGLRSVAVGEKASRKSKGFKLYPSSRIFFAAPT